MRARTRGALPRFTGVCRDRWRLMSDNNPVQAVSASRILMFIAGVCMFVAALIAAGFINGPALAWAFGGFAAYFFSGVV